MRQRKKTTIHKLQGEDRPADRGDEFQTLSLKSNLNNSLALLHSWSCAVVTPSSPALTMSHLFVVRGVAQKNTIITFPEPLEMRKVEQLMFKIAAELSSGVSSPLAPTAFWVSSSRLSYRLFQNQFHRHSNAEPGDRSGERHAQRPRLVLGGL